MENGNSSVKPEMASIRLHSRDDNITALALKGHIHLHSFYSLIKKGAKI